MRETRFDHIAIAMDRLADAPAVLVGVLGGRADRGGPGRAFRWGTWRYEGGGRLEVIEPDAAAGPDGFLQRFLERHGPGIHHVTFKVPDLRAACDRAVHVQVSGRAIDFHRRSGFGCCLKQRVKVQIEA